MASLTEVIQGVQALVQGLSKTTQVLQSVFPGITGSSSFITSTGTVTFSSSQPVGFLSVTTSSGAIVKLPYFT